MNLIYSLFNNIILNLSYLQKDYLGPIINTNIFVNTLFNFVIAFFIIFVSFHIGNKLRTFFFKETNKFKFKYLISTAIGYIFVSTGIAVLGLFSILKPEEIIIYLLLITIFVLFPNKQFVKDTKDLYEELISSIDYIKKDKIIYSFLILFILLACVNLINPEVREDQYHVDFPKIYLTNHSTMIPPREPFHVSGSPMLSEMYYTMGIFLYSEETARYIHFLFYILVILTLFKLVKNSKEKYYRFVPLLFLTAPVVIHETSSMYVDFEWMFCFLLALLILFSEEKINYKKSLLIGILLGGMLSTKLWTIVFIPTVILYIFLFLKSNFKEKIQNSLIVSLSSLFVTFIWFLRSFILTGNFLYPAFSKTFTLEKTIDNYQLGHYLSLNYALLNPLQYLNAFSPLLFLGILFLFYKFRDNIIILWKNNIFKFFLILLIIYLSINYPYGRYLLGLYVLFIFVSSVGIKRVFDKFKIVKYISYLGVLIIFLYYFINSILILPYAFGIADENKYLSRILIRDNSSYFDFGNKFNKNLTPNDYVATYGIYGYYYAPFKFIDINFILDINHRDFNLLKKNKITHLFIKGGNINWLCSNINLTNCNPNKYSLISTYQVYPTYYLYKLK